MILIYLISMMNLIQVFLQPIAYMVEMKEQLEITDLKGNKIGLMNVSGVHLLNFSCDLFIFLRSRSPPATRRARSTRRRMTSLWTVLMSSSARICISSSRLSTAEDCPINTLMSTANTRCIWMRR